MNIFIRTFNPFINSKTGIPLKPGQVRGTPEWQQFENILFDCLNHLGHRILVQPESPLEGDSINPDFMPCQRIYVHKTKRDIPHGDLFYMQMHLRNLFTIDKSGWGVDHSDYPECPGSQDEILDDSIEEIQKLSDKLLASGESKCEQPKETDETPERFILVPIQIPRDYTIHHHSPITVKYFIDSIQAWAVETQNHICFKMHPFNKSDQDLIEAVDYGCQSRYVHKVEGNIHELIKRSAGLFVINSGTGFEAIIHGKPVLTFGACDYNRVSFNADIRRLDEARNFIYSYKQDYQYMGYKFIWWYLHSHGFLVDDPKTKERIETYLKGEFGHA